MESQEMITLVNTKIVPLCLFLIMLGMGLTLRIVDFTRVLKFPKAVAVGLTNQLIFLPIVGFALANIFPLTPELAVGVMLLAVCPGGTTSNLFTHLAKGDVALSVTMTAIASVITVFTIPFIINYSLVHFMGAGTDLVLPIAKTMKALIAITILPITIGMLINRFAPNGALKAEPFIRKFAIVFLVALIVFLTYAQRDIVLSAIAQAGPVSVVLNLLTMAMGYGSARLFQLNQKQSISITIEVGLQSSSLSMVMALGMLNNYQMSFTPAIYTLVMFFSAGMLVKFLGRSLEKSGVEAAPEPTVA